MAEFICPECGETVSDSVCVCPGCGCPMEYVKIHGTPLKVRFSRTSDPAALESHAALEDPEAMYWLSYCLYYGENSFPEDEEAAEKWVRKAAEAGYPQAQADLQTWFSAETAVRAFQAPQELQGLFSRFENLIVFDVETSGLRPDADQIIELAALQVRAKDGAAVITEEFDEMVRLPKGQRLSTKIMELTGITTEILQRAGKEPETVCRQFVKLLVPGKTLMVAYNAQFDMSFLQSFLRRCGQEQYYQGLHALDAMTVYKDRRDYPHKLENAIQVYHLTDEKNSHHAIDDTRSLLAVLKAMDQERNDLEKYIDLFGYNSKWGVNGPRLPGIRYASQPYNNYRRLYE